MTKSKYVSELVVTAIADLNRFLKMKGGGKPPFTQTKTYTIPGEHDLKMGWMLYSKAYLVGWQGYEDAYVQHLGTSAAVAAYSLESTLGHHRNDVISRAWRKLEVLQNKVHSVVVNYSGMKRTYAKIPKTKLKKLVKGGDVTQAQVEAHMKGMKEFGEVEMVYLDDPIYQLHRWFTEAVDASEAALTELEKLRDSLESSNMPQRKWPHPVLVFTGDVGGKNTYSNVTYWGEELKFPATISGAILKLMHGEHVIDFPSGQFKKCDKNSFREHVDQLKADFFNDSYKLNGSKKFWFLALLYGKP